MKNDDNESKSLKTQYKGGSPLALETKNMLKKAPKPIRTEKQLVFEKENKGDSLLDESQLHE